MTPAASAALGLLTAALDGDEHLKRVSFAALDPDEYAGVLGAAVGIAVLLADALCREGDHRPADVLTALRLELDEVPA